MSFDSDSELSSLPSDYEDDDDPLFTPPSVSSKKAQHVTRASTQRATVKSKRDVKRGAYLKPPRTANYSTSALYNWILDKSLDLDPEYQRDVVWTDAKQSFLIDSVFHNYHIPQIIFATTLTDEGEMKRTCIDGKQRLTSIERFMSGEIPFKDSLSGRKKWFKDGPGPKRKLLEDHERRRFEWQQIPCVEYDGITADQEREIFQRVQMGVSLTPAERLSAINGPHADLTRVLQAHLDSEDGFVGHLEWTHARGKDFQSMARIVFLIGTSLKEGNGAKAKSKPLEPTIVRLEPFLKRKTLIADNLEAVARTTIDIFCRIARHPELSWIIRKSEKLAPLEFVMIAYLIYCYQLVLSETQLADAIAQLRSSIRTHCTDTRFNNKAYKHALTFILNVRQLRLKSNGQADVSAANAASSSMQQRANAAGRRNRAPPVKELGDDEMDVSEDDKPLSHARPATSTKTGVKRKRDSSLVSKADSDDGGSVRKRAPARPRTAVSRSAVKAGTAAPESTGKTTKKVPKTPPKKASAASAKTRQIGIPSKRPPPSSKTKPAPVSTPPGGRKAIPSCALNSNVSTTPSAPPVCSTSALPGNLLSLPKRGASSISTSCPASSFGSGDRQTQPGLGKYEARNSLTFQAGPSGGSHDRLQAIRDAKAKHPPRKSQAMNASTSIAGFSAEPQDVPQKPPSQFPNFQKQLWSPNIPAPAGVAPVPSTSTVSVPEIPDVSVAMEKLDSYFTSRPSQSNAHGVPVAFQTKPVSRTSRIPAPTTYTEQANVNGVALMLQSTSIGQTLTMPPAALEAAESRCSTHMEPRAMQTQRTCRVARYPPPKQLGGLPTPAPDSMPVLTVQLPASSNSVASLPPKPCSNSTPGNPSAALPSPIISPNMNLAQLPLTPAASATPPTPFLAAPRLVPLTGTPQQPTPSLLAEGSSIPGRRRSFTGQTAADAGGLREKQLLLAKEQQQLQARERGLQQPQYGAEHRRNAAPESTRDPRLAPVQPPARPQLGRPGDSFNGRGRTLRGPRDGKCEG